MHIRKTKSIWLLTAAFTSCLFTTARAGDLDKYVESRLRQLHIPGASVAVVRNGQVIEAHGYGQANLEWRVPAARETVYEIGSMTKQFTATAIMMLVEEGKIGLDDSVRKYFAAAPETWNSITVRNLLNHTSGIQNHVAVPGYLSAFRTNLLMETTPGRDELLKMFFKLPLEFQPGETWAYDNTGYILLGLIIEMTSGKSYWQFVDERIFKPLGMNSTRSTDPRPIVTSRAAGYEWLNDRFENRPILAPFIAFSAGSILSTVDDLARWDAALYSEHLLKQSSLDQMWTAARTNDGRTAPFSYGFGWFVDTYHGHRLVQHSGGTPGFSSAIYRFVDDKLSIIILTNHADTILDQMAIDIAGMYVPALKRTKEAIDSDPQTSLRLRSIMSGLLKGSHDPASFTPAMRIFLSTATGKAFWKWYASLGELGLMTFSDREDADETRVFRYQVVLGGNAYWVSFATDADGRIARICLW